jgi:hypothetical protein
MREEISQELQRKISGRQATVKPVIDEEGMWK